MSISKTKAYLLGKKACEQNKVFAADQDQKYVEMITVNRDNAAAILLDWNRGYHMADLRMGNQNDAPALTE